MVFTPGRYNAAYFEHSYLAERTDSVLAESRDLFVENDVLWYQGMEQTYRVGAIYRRVSDEYLDPVTFLPDSFIGIPNLMAVYRTGNVAIINTPGNGVADDTRCSRTYVFSVLLVEGEVSWDVVEDRLHLIILGTK